MSSRHRRDPGGAGRALGEFAPSNLAQWVMLVVVMLVLVAGVGSYAYVRLLAPDSLARGSDATYRWDGGKLVLKGQLRRGGGCVIVPDAGARRRVDAHAGLGRTVVEPWFSGGANVTNCTVYSSVWTGWRAELAAVVLASSVFWVFALGLGILVVLYAIVSPKARRRRADLSPGAGS